LARKVVFGSARLDVHNHIPELGRTVGEALLEPTRIYTRAVKELLAHYRVKRVVRGIAHITGGGMVENIPRILPQQCEVVIRKGSWPVPPLFDWLRRLGGIDETEMYRVFNMGLGLVLVVRPYFCDHIVRQLSRLGFSCWPIGEVRAGPARVVLA
jgi:phosphoribosylformylglycinamidine cyclo-ligase